MMPDKNQKTTAIVCYNCKFFEREFDECRRKSPEPAWLNAPFPQQPTKCCAWPKVGDRDWCGDFQRKLQPPEDGWIYEGEDHPQDNHVMETGDA